jgi:hypothetical protein
MALSDTVETSLREAEASLRNALSFAARQERPFVNSVIADMISKIDNLIKLDSFVDHFDSMAEKQQRGQSPWEQPPWE